MRRIRTQLALLTLLVAILGILGTAFYMARSYIADKRNYIVDQSSAAAPGIADSVSIKVAGIIAKTSLFETAIEEGSGRTARKAPPLFLSKIFDGSAGVSGVRIYRNGRLLHDIGLDSAVPGDADPAVPDFEPKASPFFAKSGRPGEVLLVAPADSRAGPGFYLFRIQRAFFQSASELGPALHPIVVDKNGTSYFQETSPGIDIGQMTDSLPNLNQGAVFAREVIDRNGKRRLIVLSRIKGVSNASILLQAPMANAFDLVWPVLKSSSPFLVLIVFFSILLSALFAAKVARPIEELTEAAAKISKGEWKLPDAGKGSFEINRLVRAFARMVTDLEARDKEISRTNQELVRSERLAALGRFGAGIAHEVKNPLASILGYAQLIRRKLPAPLEEKETQYLGFIMDETKRASKIITDLLMFARQKPPELVIQPISPLLERTLAMYRPDAETKGIALRLEFAPGAEESRSAIDPDQFFQVLANLVSNALQALEEKEKGERTVTLRAAQEDGRLIVEVKDDGPGISDENLKRLFEPFFSTKEVGRGSGLGLALSLGIVEQHHGKIDVISGVGEGTTFRISLPSPGIG